MRIPLVICFLLGTSGGTSLGRPGSSLPTPVPLQAAYPTIPTPDAVAPPRRDASAKSNVRNAPGQHPVAANFNEDWYIKWYSDFLDKIIKELDDWVSRTQDPDQKDLERISCAIGFHTLIEHMGESWTIAMLDSASKLQSGLLQGNLHDLGMYDQCVGISVAASESDPSTSTFSGQHCLVSFNFHVPNNTITMGGEETKLVDLFGVDWIPLTVGQCYPSICTPEVLQEAINAVLSAPDGALSLFGVSYSVDVTIDATDCHVKDSGSYDVLDWIVAAIIFFFFFLCGCCTAIDYFYLSRESRKRLSRPLEAVLMAFSLHTNGSKLLDTRQPADAMTSLNGMKALSIAWVVLGHRYRYLINQPLVNLLVFPTELQKWEKMILLSGPLSVDTFFLISGLLNMYIFAIMREKKRFSLFETPIMYIHRYLRLTPAYLVMIAITATWLYRAGDGPYWDRLVGTARQDCRDNFWENIVYLNNYLNPDHYCMMQSWYLSADMQMFWLSIFVVYPLWRWPVFGFVEVTVLTIASILSPMLVSYFYQIRAPIPLTTDADKSSKEMALLYLPTHTKTVSYVVGIMAGYLLYNIKREKIRFRPSKVTLTFFWLASAVFMLFAMFGGYTVYQRDDNYSRIYSAFYIGFYRFFWAIGLVWIMVACISGYGGPLNTILSWPAFGPLAKLSYCVYLTHVAVILRGIASNRVPLYFSDYNQVELYLGDLVISYGAAAVLSLVFEAPMMQLEKLIFGRGTKKPTNPRPRQQEGDHTHTA